MVMAWPGHNQGLVGSFTCLLSFSFPDHRFSFAKNTNPLYLILYSLFFIILFFYNSMQGVVLDN